MEYFDSRGVRRTYGVSLDDGVLRMWREQPGFDQRFSATVGPDAFEGQWQVAQDAGGLAGRPEGHLPPPRLGLHAWGRRPGLGSASVESRRPDSNRGPLHYE